LLIIQSFIHYIHLFLNELKCIALGPVEVNWSLELALSKVLALWLCWSSFWREVPASELSSLRKRESVASDFDFCDAATYNRADCEER